MGSFECVDAAIAYAIPYLEGEGEEEGWNEGGRGGGGNGKKGREGVNGMKEGEEGRESEKRDLDKT